MEIKVKTEAQHHCKLVEWDSISALGCTPIKQNVIERDFDIEEHNKIIYNQALEDFASLLIDNLVDFGEHQNVIMAIDRGRIIRLKKQLVK